MKTLYYDCFAGISGDMNLGALIDAGVNPAKLESALRGLGVSGWELEISRESRGGIFGTRANVVLQDVHSHCGLDAASEHSHAHCDCQSADKHSHSHCESGARYSHSHHHEHRSFADIKRIIGESNLSENVKKTSLKIFETLARAEAKVHGKTVEEVRFHEVGAVDSIVDIVGAAVCFDLLGIDKIVSSAVELGSGVVKCAHGLMPVPAPATAELAKSFPLRLGGAPHEATTPTGAAILAAMCFEFEPKLSGKIVSTGVGIGGRDLHEIANVLRVCIYQSDCAKCADFQLISENLSLLSANIDDMTAESLAALVQKLFDCGCPDVWQEPIVMKKGRLGTKVCALCNPQNAAIAEKTFYENSSTLGIRKSVVERSSLPRNQSEFESSLGRVRIKTATFGDSTKIKPEADDVKNISSRTNICFDEISKKIRNEIENRGSD